MNLFSYIKQVNSRWANQNINSYIKWLFIMLKSSQKFSEKSFFDTKLGLSEKLLRSFSTYQLWANLITDKKDYIQIVSKLVIPGKGSSGYRKYGVNIQFVSFCHLKSPNHYTEPMKILPVVVTIFEVLQLSLTKQLNFYQHPGGLMVSSLAFRWKGHGFESHSV